jgi:excisionase family DNA binding protein
MELRRSPPSLNGQQERCPHHGSNPLHYAEPRLDGVSETAGDAATCLGVSPQTVYLWVERKQIPHLRVMGRNIRFLQSDLEPFRAQFKQEVVDGTTQ